MAFDMDGVLVESRAAVKAAYQRAGVVMPDDAWGKPASAWLDDPDGVLHRRKNAEYAVALRLHGHRLPGADLLRTCVREGCYVAVVTHASREAGATVLEWLDIPVRLISTENKYEALADLEDSGVYVDDNYTPVPSGWEFVQYRDNLTFEKVIHTWMP